MDARGSTAGTDNDIFMRLCLRSRWQPEVLSEAEDLAVSGRLDWPALCDTARANGLAPLLYDALRSSQFLPTAVVDCLQNAYQETAVYAGLMSLELSNVLHMLADVGLPVIVLKGAALGDTLYGNSALRPMTDLDLLLDERDITTTIDVLRQRGYQSAGVEVRPGHTLNFENELVIRSPGIPSLAIELHWHLLDSPFYQDHLNEGWFWDTARPARLVETDALVLGLEASILHMSAHYVLHHKAQGMRWICDIAGLALLFGTDIDWQLVLDKAAGFRLVTSVQVVLQQLVDDWGVAIPSDVMQAAGRLPVSEEERRVVQWLQSEQRPVVQRFWADLAGMSGWRRRASFLLANLFPSAKYMQDRYELPDRAMVPLAYPYRWAIGVREVIISRRAAASERQDALMERPRRPGESLPALQGWLPLLQESLASEGRFRWQLAGKSMEPTLPDGCQIEIVPLQGAASLGSVVVFASSSALVAHRLVHRRGRYLVMQGDGRREPDRWLLPVQLVGRVDKAWAGEYEIWPAHGESLRRWRWVGRAYALAGRRRLRRLLSGHNQGARS